MTTQAPHPLALTAAGKRLADARVEAAMDAFYPGEDWRVALGIALPDSLRDMRAAIAAADAAAEILFPAEGAGLREALVPFAAFNDAATFPGSTWSKEPDSADARHITGISAPLTIGMFRAASVALASPQPAAEGPVAAGVGEDDLAAYWRKKWHKLMGAYDAMASIVHGETVSIPVADYKTLVAALEADDTFVNATFAAHG